MRNKIYPILLVLILAWSCTSNTNTKNQSTTVTLSDSLKIDSINTLIRENPKQAHLYAERSELHFNLGNINQAIADLHIANAIDTLNPQYYLQLADFYLQLGKSERVNKLLMTANKISPDNKEVLYRLGNLYFYVNKHKKALKFLNQASTIDPYFAKVYFSKALVLLEMGDTSKAVTNLQIAVEREPDYYDAYMQLGLLYATRNDSLAVDYYDNALRIIPNSYEALYAKAYFYQKTEQLQKAVNVYNQMLLDLSDELPMVHHNLGYIEMIYYQNYNAAITHFDNAIKYKPDYTQAYSNKGYCYEQLHNKTAARKAYKKALEITPNFQFSVQGLNRLDKN